MDWNNTYREENLGSGTTIQNQRPAHLIARAITEIQALVPNQVEVMSGDESPKIEGNVLYIGSGLPSGGADAEVLQRDSSGNAYWGAVRAL